MITKTIHFVDGKKVREFEGLEGGLYAGEDVDNGIRCQCCPKPSPAPSGA